MPGAYDAFQAAITQHMGRPLTQEELDNSPFLETLPNELIRLLPPGRLEAFTSARLVQLDNADLFALVMNNPHIANSIPGYRLTQGVQNSDGSWSGGLASDQLRRIYQRAGEQGIGGPGITELKGVIERVTGAPVPGGGGGGSGGSGGDQAAPTLAREQWEAELANQPGNVYEWLARSRGMEPVGGPRQIGGPTASAPPGSTMAPGLGPAPSSIPAAGQSGFGPASIPPMSGITIQGAAMAPMSNDLRARAEAEYQALVNEPYTEEDGEMVQRVLPNKEEFINRAIERYSRQADRAGASTLSTMGKVAGAVPNLSTLGASKPPGYGEPGNSWANAGSQIVNQQRPTFDQLRGQVQAQGADIPIGILNTVQGLDLPSYTTQGGMPLLAAQNRANMSPAEIAVWDVTVNRTGGRAEDDRYQASRLGRTGLGATVAYTGASRTPGVRR